MRNKMKCMLMIVTFYISITNCNEKVTKTTLKLEQNEISNVIPSSPYLLTNVVDEVPTLDVGPLTTVTVVEGKPARLPCKSQTGTQHDTVRLILWYRNDTSRPFLSYDARHSKSVSPYKHIWKANSRKRRKRSKRWRRRMDGRVSLTEEGSVFVMKEVDSLDQAEYRCTVHYKNIPAVTYRLQLQIKRQIDNVRIFNRKGNAIHDEIGPLSEGSHLSLLCRANCTGALISLEWLMEGEVLSTVRSMLAGGESEVALELDVGKHHTHSTLTCRLTCRLLSPSKTPLSSITDVSTVLIMYYVPQATLLVDQASSDKLRVHHEGFQGGATVDIEEKNRIRFICAVRARPPPYSVTWMLNGRVLHPGGRRRISGNSSLDIYPAKRSDAGLYACLASNTEGDGHSNAIMLRVTHPPYCIGDGTEKRVIVARDTSVTLSCAVESEPANVTFTWRVNQKRPDKTKDLQDGGVINGEHTRFKYVPKLIDLVPRNTSTQDHFSGSTYMAYGPSLPHSVNPTEPTRSHLVLNPTENNMKIVCFAKNRVGRMKVPCTYKIVVVDAPPQLEGCSVIQSSTSSVEVECSGREREIQPVTQLVVGPSYVRSPEVRTHSTLEIWSMGTLVANVTQNDPHFLVRGLPPDTDFRLRLYNASPHAKSKPIVLFARTDPNVTPTSEEYETIGTESESLEDVNPELNTSTDGSIDWIIIITASIVGSLILLGIIVGALVYKYSRIKEISSANSELQQRITGDDAQSESMWESPASVGIRHTNTLSESTLDDENIFIREPSLLLEVCCDIHDIVNTHIIRVYQLQLV